MYDDNCHLDSFIYLLQNRQRQLNINHSAFVDCFILSWLTLAFLLTYSWRKLYSGIVRTLRATRADVPSVNLRNLPESRSWCHLPSRQKHLLGKLWYASRLQEQKDTTKCFLDYQHCTLRWSRRLHFACLHGLLSGWSGLNQLRAFHRFSVGLPFDLGLGTLLTLPRHQTGQECSP